MLANHLAHAVLGRTLDELPPQTRKLLGLVSAWVQAQCQRDGQPAATFRFTRRQVREATGWGNTQLKVHLGRLADMEYLTVHGGVRGQGFVYGLRFDGDIAQEAPQWMGLIDAATLTTTTEWSEAAGSRSARGRGVVGAKPAGGRSASSAEIAGKPAVEIESSSSPLLTRMNSGTSDHRSHTASSFLAAAALDG